MHQKYLTPFTQIPKRSPVFKALHTQTSTALICISEWEEMISQVFLPKDCKHTFYWPPAIGWFPEKGFEGGGGGTTVNAL